MSDGTLLIHAVNHPTVTLFVEAAELRQNFLADHPEEPGPSLTVRIDAPDGVSITPSSNSNLGRGYQRPEGEFMLIVDSDDMVRASFDWSVDVPDRSHLDSDTIQITLSGPDGRTHDHANILI